MWIVWRGLRPGRLAETFLLNQRNRQGWWVDFRLAPGFSDEWVTAYVGTVLASIPNARLEGAARDAWDLLQTRRRSAGAWGYNAFTPDDADSTTWGILLADAVGAGDVDRVKQARRRLEQHIRPNGGVATYAEDGPIRQFIRAPAHRSFRGWCGPQACVTAAVAALPDFTPRVHEYLRHAQQDDGRWKSYWWCDDDYATALAAEALAQSGQHQDSSRVECAACWALSRVAAGYVATDDHPHGSPFATAWCLRTLLLAPGVPGTGDAVQRATSWLCRQQRADGSWQPSARLRVPFPDDEHPDTSTQWTYHGQIEGSIVFDGRGVFTTATVLRAIHPALNPESGPQS